MIPWLVNYPLLTLGFTLVLMWVAMRVGQYLGRRKPPTDENSKDLDRVTSANLTFPRRPQCSKATPCKALLLKEKASCIKNSARLVLMNHTSQC